MAGGDLSNLRVLEKKMAKRLGEGVERLGEIIKDVAKAQRRLDSRTSALELKVLGQSKAAEPAKKKATAGRDKDALTSSAR